MLFVGTVYQWIGIQKDQGAFLPVGQLYDVYGKKMHLYSDGTGEVTVVFASGWGTVSPYTDFYPLTRRFASFAKVAVYDRPGTGFSELTGRKRDIDSMVDEIHTLLQASGQKPPYVFVGHSLGSLETIRYAQIYPEEVKGILLIDGGTPEYYGEMPAIAAISHIQRFVVNTGIARALLQSRKIWTAIQSERNELKELPEELQDLEKRALLLKGFNRNMTDELRLSKVNAVKVSEGAKPLDVPLIALTAGGFGQTEVRWLESQKEWVGWSTDAEQKAVRASKHYIHHYEPDLVIEQLKKLVRNERS